MQIIYEEYIIDVKKGTRVVDLLKDEIAKSRNKVIACRFNNEVKSLSYEIDSDGKIELIDLTDKDGIRIYRRGLIYIIGKAFYETYPEALLTINYQLSNSLLGEVDNMKVTKEMIEKVDKKVKEIIKRDAEIKKVAMTKEEAEKFYQENHTLKGKLQLDVKNKKEIMLYYCEDYYNYFYGVMPLSTGIIDIYELLEYDGRFLVRYPSRKNPNELPEFKENKKLLATLDEYEDLHETLNVHTLYKLNKIIDENRIKDYILLDEALHEKKMAQIADDIVKRGKVKVVLIAGPSSSGKTTFARRLGLQLRLNGLKPVTISVDNYFVERNQNPKDEFGKYDFECLEAIDIDLFNSHILKLLNGEEIKVPTFDFEHGTKLYKGNTMKLEDDQILVIEGIHCLNDKLTQLIPKEQKYKVYISALTVLNIDYYNRISTTDTRLIRRIVRDNQFRGYSALHTLKMWDSVNRGEERNIFPYQEEADSMFNSSLIYELAVLKDYAMPLLKEIDNSHPEFSEAKRIYRMLGYFESIPGEYVPQNSLLREFIGGSIFEE
ncbi:MAG TPA: nucleoside kinase [Clostridiaceae bacterium]|nr:nucleoside kinase [Clostridiaceae bacterium]